MIDNNEQIKQLIRKKRLRQWEIADVMNLREETLSRLLRKPLSLDVEERIKAAIEKIEQRESGDGD